MLEGDSQAVRGPPAVGLAIGLVVGLPLAAGLIAAVSLTHEALMGVATISVQCTATALRAVDRALLRVRHIKVRCVACFERISYPAYLCPNPRCRKTHWNIRPGRYGVLRRTCQCGRRMPTLLLLGSARQLDAICPHRACKQPLEHRPGEEREIIFPIFGSKGAGKTLLLYGIIKTLQASVRPGIHVGYADSATAARMRDFDSALAEGFAVPATAPGELPKAYVLRLRIGRYRRIAQLFDAAGELFYDSQRSANLVYLGAANTFVLVIDPLSINDFWDHLPSAERDRLTAYRSIAPHPQPVFQQTADRITEMGRQRAPRRLAIVFSRAEPGRDRVRARGERGRRSPGMGGRRPGTRRAPTRGQIGLPGSSLVPHRGFRQQRERPDQPGPLAHASRRDYSPGLSWSSAHPALIGHRGEVRQRPGSPVLGRSHQAAGRPPFMLAVF